MAISANVIFDVRTTGSDTLNGGGFDPSVTAGMFTDGAATVADTDSPVFTSASYTFVAGDVGAWLYVGLGTNWTRGWYEIASVAGGAATLKAAIGEARPINLAGATSNFVCYDVNTVAGCATVASPTSATWSIDYSQQDAAQFSYTDLASAGAGLTVSSAITPFGKQMVGNMLVVASGTNFTAGNYIIASVSVGLVATVTGPANITTGAGASGVGGLGGAMATPGFAMGKRVLGNKLFMKSGTYTLTTSTLNVSGGPLSVANNTGGVGISNVGFIIGWDAVRSVLNVPSANPLIDVGAVTAITVITTLNTTTYMFFANIDIEGNGNGAIIGCLWQANPWRAWNIHVANATTGFSINSSGGNSLGYYLTATGCGANGFLVGSIFSGDHSSLYFCEAHGNGTNGFDVQRGTMLYRCIAGTNTAAGFTCGSGPVGFSGVNLVAYDNGSDGFVLTPSSESNTFLVNCIAEGNADKGYEVATSASRQLTQLINCAGHDNTGGDYNSSYLYNVIGFITQSAGSFFTNAAGGDFSLNNTAGQGALLVGTGYPQLFPAGVTPNFEDIGASQSVAGGGGGGGVNPFNGLIVSM
jgi:hypothetical protein